MATDLYAITNSSLKQHPTQREWNVILEKLKNLQFDTISIIQADNSSKKLKGEWCLNLDDYEEFSYIQFGGPFMCTVRLYPGIAVIDTIYRYNLIYKANEIYFFKDFRKDLFEVVSILGGSEIIYLADNGCNRLSTYLEAMAEEATHSYKEIKEVMIAELGNPVTDYAQLDNDKLTYSKITEFFLDDFSDLRNT